ncbi:MAG: EAL domain-containing protein [Pseudomonadota bacterium]
MTLVHVDQSDAARTLLAGLEQAIDAVVMIDSRNTVIHFNAAAERLWGYERAEVLGRNVGFLVSTAVRSQHDGYIAANRATGVNRIVGHSHEVKIERRDGSEIWGSVSMSRVEVNGEITYMGFVRDVTEDVKRREEITRLSLVVDKTNRAIYIAGRDARICYVNGAFAEMFGYSLEEATGLIPEDFLVGAYTSQATLAYLYQQIRTAGSAEDEILLYDKAGNEVWVSVALNGIHDEDGKLQHLVALMTDITEGKQLQSLQHLILEALADEQPLLDMMDTLCRKVEQIAPDAVCSVLHVDSTGLLHPLGGPGLPEGYAQALDGLAVGPDVGSCGTSAFRGQPVLAIDIENDPLWLPYNSAPLAAGLKACWSVPIKAKDGRVIGTFAFYFRESRRPSRWHRCIVDACVHLAAVAIEREEARNEISRLAYIDALTGLPNRTHMRQLMERAVAECSADAQMALIFLDLDHFKDVNDTLGHAVGDELLVAVTQRLHRHIRPGDILGRQGGDEFIVLMPNCIVADASRIASRLTEALSVPLQLSSNQVSISASAGISMFPDNARDLDSLLKYADAAMYKAKQAGRSTHRFFSNDMDCVNEERLRLSTALRHAVAQGGLRLHYQPQICAGSGDLYGVEALARWHDPVLGDVSPAKFIPLAEECGLIEQIGIWSLREACRQIAAWQKTGLDVPCVSVNLSPINFLNPELPALVSDIIVENGLAPNRLMLEITEGVVMSEHTTAIEIMKQIRAAGIGLSMDDFGTGYSSLSRLAHLPVRELKIDRSFMRDIETEVCALAIATAVVRVGQSLNMTVVAEGVETEGQRRILAELGCDVIQGFLYSPALAAFDFEAWLVARHAGRWATLVSGRRAEALQQETRSIALAAM